MAGTSSRKNAFAYFVEEYEAEQIARGRKITKKQILDECTSGWSVLDPETRLRYCNMANPMLDREGKSTERTPSNMEWLDPVTGEYGEKWFRYVRSGDELYYLNNAIPTLDRTPRSITELKRFNFYFVHFNYFCKPGQKKYVPAELGLVEFNLAEGIKESYHTLINPGSIPLGFAHEAKRLSEEGHGLPIPPNSMGEKDMGKIADAVKRFLQFGTSKTGKYPPLFTVVENVLPAMHMLNSMVSYNEDQPVFTVYPTHRMFHWIKNKCNDISGAGAGFLDESFALKEIERDCFRYIVEIACSFHKQCDSRFPMCSLSIAKRLALTVSSHCCIEVGNPVDEEKNVSESLSDSSAEEDLEDEDEDEDEDEEEEEEEESEEDSDDEDKENREEWSELELDDNEEYDCEYDDNREVPDFVAGLSTKQLPDDRLKRLNRQEMCEFYRAFMHNLLDSNNDFGFGSKEDDHVDFLKAEEARMLEDPFDDEYFDERRTRDYESLEEELEAFRRYEKRQLRNQRLARIRSRLADEAREEFERKLAEIESTRMRLAQRLLDWPPLDQDREYFGWSPPTMDYLDSCLT